MGTKSVNLTNNEIQILSYLTELNRHADDIGLVCEKILEKLDNVLELLELIENHLRYGNYGGGEY
jgi:hypothetical protein